MSQDQELHALVTALTDLAQELGQTPTQQQATKHIKSYQARREFIQKTHLELVAAAGLAPARQQRITNAIFNKDIDEHLDKYEPKEMGPRMPWPTIAVMGDMHEPFGSDRVKADFVSHVGRNKPEYIVQVGDGMDMYAHSRFPKSLNVFTPIDEETRAKRNLDEFWKACRSAAPDAKCVELLGNHCVRALKMVLQAAPSVEHWAQKYLKELFTFEGVETILDPRQEYVIADIAFLHGYLGKLGDHRDYMLMNAVRGHDHVGGVTFRKIHGRILWELDAGFAGDINAKGFTYTNQKMTKTTEGFGWIDSYGPRFIPSY